MDNLMFMTTAEHIAAHVKEHDLIEAVRCKDCATSGHCDIESVLSLYDEPANTYCSEGERK